MKHLFESLPFQPADILLPQGCDLSRWAVVACDQYTSQPEYWERVRNFVGENPSTLHMVLPESCLEGPDVEADIAQINKTMTEYQRENRFIQYDESMIYIERTLDDGMVRRGIVGMADLEQYDYTVDSQAKIRATEGTVTARIPPRVAVRKHASVEFPHILLLMDDVEKTVIEPLSARKDSMEKVYDFTLMERGGEIRGWRLGQEELSMVAAALHALADPENFRARYHLAQDAPVFLFAMGDGNHSMATAKECYERQKKITPQDQWDTLPARYALCELGNLHDESLVFEPIHRVVFGVSPEMLLADMKRAFPQMQMGRGQGHTIGFCYGETRGEFTIEKPTCKLEVATLQGFLDQWLQENPDAKIDYIHGDDVVRMLAREDHAIGFILPPMEKSDLFPSVMQDGVLPRKTFSMGHAHDKRFYLEGRRIRR